ncbi:MAG: BlaI/MecI/CopY family transcriptional regulator [Candidatus Hydrogenedentes bacterium]|nr:BlaI/MecI/CopY family transcriptional regulator [Candidatus Hydrogenedentota bacterium]
MARPSSRYPTELELEILKILWADGPSPVRHVRDALAGFRDLAYTSVMTIMTIMAKKGYLRRARNGNSYVYHPILDPETTKRDMVADLVDRLFEGSTASAMLHLLETCDIDDAEMDALRALVQRKPEEKS